MSRSHKYDQHYLRSPRLTAELVGHSNIRKKDLVYDFGAGSGVISSVLSRRCREVVAVEIEPSAIRLLRKNLHGLHNVRVIEEDILGVTLPSTPYKVFSNPPFSLSSSLVKKLIVDVNPPTTICLIVQRQFARKVVPSDHHFTSALGAQIAPFFSSRIRRPLSKADFTPPPAVDTVLLELKQHAQPLLPFHVKASYGDFVARCFAEQIFFLSLPLIQCGISPGCKPSEVTPEQWISLYTITHNN